MKTNFQKGFIIPLIIGIVAVLIIVGGAYVIYKNENIVIGPGSAENQRKMMDDAIKYASQNQTSTTNSSQSTSTNTQPAPFITSINPSSGPIGTIVELKGNNLGGFEGELDAWIENSNGEKAFLSGIGSVPRADQTIRVKIDSQLCKFDYGMKGEPVGGCTSYLTITPGAYKIYTYPWGNMSNTVQFIITTPASQVINPQPSITVYSPNKDAFPLQATFKVGDTINILWTKSNVNELLSLAVDIQDSNGKFIQSIEKCGTLQKTSEGYRWIIPATFPQGQYKFYVSTCGGGSGSGVVGSTSNVFSIISSSTNTQPSITVVSPNGGENLAIGSQQKISWNISGNLPVGYWTLVTLDAQQGGFISLSTSTANSLIWQVPSQIAYGDQLGDVKLGPHKIYVSVYNSRPCYGFCSDPQSATGTLITKDQSDNYFTITSNTTQPSITILSPNGGAVWKMGQTYTISYTVNGDVGPMTIKLDRYSDDHTLIQSIDIGTSDTNSFTYKVPTSLEDTKGAAGMYKIEIYPATGRELITRSDYFSIIR